MQTTPSGRIASAVVGTFAKHGVHPRGILVEQVERHERQDRPRRSRRRECATRRAPSSILRLSSSANGISWFELDATYRFCNSIQLLSPDATTARKNAGMSSRRIASTASVTRSVLVHEVERAQDCAVADAGS